MFRKYKYSFAIVLLVSCLLAFLYVNGNKKTYANDLNKSIKDVIENNQEEYDYMEDEYFMNKLDDLVKFAYKDKELLDEHYVFEDLDKDSIPEIIVFSQRDSNDYEDEGSLDVHKYINGRYTMIDSVSMNYDNTCYELKSGNLSKDIKGIYLNNQVGAHSGMTYGFILENNKIVSILNPKKINLLSVYTNNEIKDINNDGILDFSIYTIDPEDKEESIVDSNKILLWYQWDGKDSANLTFVDREDNDIDDISSHDRIVGKGLRILNDNPSLFIDYLDSNLENLNKTEVSSLLAKYLQGISSKVSNLNKRDLKQATRGAVKHIGLDNSRDFDNMLVIDNIKSSPDDLNNILINFDYFSKKYKDNVSAEFIDLLDILSIKATKVDSSNDYLDSISTRIVKIENFKSIYPYSEFISYLNKIYKKDISTLFFEDQGEDKLSTDNKINVNRLNKLIKIKNTYPNTNLSSLIESFLDRLNENNLIIDDDIKENIAISYK